MEPRMLLSPRRVGAIAPDASSRTRALQSTPKLVRSPVRHCDRRISQRAAPLGCAKPRACESRTCKRA